MKANIGKRLIFFSKTLLNLNLEELWSFTIDYDLRVVFYFLENDKVVFVDIGKHDEVY